MENRTTEIKEIVEKYKDKIRDGCVYFAPNIPVDKQKRVLESYAEEAVFEEILILIDDTLFGGAKDGVTITDHKIYTHSLLESPYNFELKAIESARFAEGSPNAIYINETKFTTLSFPSELSLQALAKMLTEIGELFHPKQVTAPANAEPVVVPVPFASPLEALKQLKELFDMGILTEAEFNEKKKKYIDML